MVGAASRDLYPADPRGWRLGGGVTYGAMAAVRLGMSVRALIGVDREAASAQELDQLRRAGIDVRVVSLASGPVFDNREGRDGRQQVCHAASDRLSVEALPDTWRDVDCVVLNPVAGELDDAWAETLPPSTPVALGWQGLVRRLVPGRAVESLPIRPSALIARADLAVVSAEDARAGGAPLQDLLGRVAQQLVVTHGRRPALHVMRSERGFRMRLLPVEATDRPRHPVGAGDVLLVTWAAAVACLRARGSDTEPWRALALALAAASAKVSTPLFAR